MEYQLTPSQLLPIGLEDKSLVGRAWSTEHRGPCTILLKGTTVFDLTAISPTMSALLERSDLLAALKDTDSFPILGDLTDFLFVNNDSDSAGHLLAPCDLQPVKAAGVTFVESVLERLIEEQAGGEPRKAQRLRDDLAPLIGDKLQGFTPGSETADEVKKVLTNAGIWSQYLEVGIGKDAEIFSKAPPMASVGVGHEIGIRADSSWNNPEPETVLAITSAGNIVGATLGNDVNLRDFEGRSGLLLNVAKDNNASCAIGPFIRLFDDNFTINNILTMEISLEIYGEDSYEVKGINRMNQISRSPQELVTQLINSNHQYPDGVMLFLGTMFVPTKDRLSPDSGFTHKVGDKVVISSPELGSLINWVNLCDQITPWRFGILALIDNLHERGLL